MLLLWLSPPSRLTNQSVWLFSFAFLCNNVLPTLIDLIADQNRSLPPLIRTAATAVWLVRIAFKELLHQLIKHNLHGRQVLLCVALLHFQNTKAAASFCSCKWQGLRMVVRVNALAFNWHDVINVPTPVIFPVVTPRHSSVHNDLYVLMMCLKLMPV